MSKDDSGNVSEKVEKSPCTYCHGTGLVAGGYPYSEMDCPGCGGSGEDVYVPWDD